MPDSHPVADAASVLPDIDAAYRPTLDERLRQGFVSVLRKFASTELRAAMHDDYRRRVAPAMAKVGTPVDWRAIAAVMETAPSYRFYSVTRYNAQEMVWHSVQNAVERGLPEMIAAGRAVSTMTPSCGSLHLDPDLAVPRYVSGLDVHLIPGSFSAEHAADDVAQGAVVSHGGDVFYASMPHLRGIGGGVAQSIAHWLALTAPDFKPRRMLDLGTGTGRNLMPYLDAFPGLEAHGIDVSAPGLRYGHAVAARDGYPIHFRQANAAALEFASGSFDLIVSSFFFHEIPVAVTRQVLTECHRLLAPGGRMIHMELPPEKSLDAWENFRWNWDTANNNEPSYTQYRAQDPMALCTAAGFAADAIFETRIPDLATFGRERFAAFVAGKLEAPPHGAGGWYLFGGAKPI
jgi:ubiquinone/menaquinone biosynthesis C-methylase UbiE